MINPRRKKKHKKLKINVQKLIYNYKNSATRPPKLSGSAKRKQAATAIHRTPSSKKVAGTTGVGGGGKVTKKKNKKQTWKGKK
jgi:hypothetical protein